MNTFTDSTRQEWAIEFDALIFEAIERDTGIDLADLSAGGLAKVESDVKALVKVLCVVLKDQIQAAKLTPPQFAKRIRGETITDAVQAIAGGLADFFPVNVWSAVQQRWNQRREAADNLADVAPMLEMLNQPGMEAMRAPILEALTAMIGGGSSEALQAVQSAVGQAGTQSPNATTEPAKSESIQAA